MRDYQKGRRDREPLVRELHGLGLSDRDIAYLIDSSSATVRQDVTKMGGAAAFPRRPRKDQDVYARVFRRYAELRTQAAERTKFEQGLFEILSSCHIVKEALATARGAASLVERLLQPAFPAGRDGYNRLIQDVFGSWERNERVISSNGELRGLLIDVAKGTIQPPNSPEHFRSILIERMLSTSRSNIMPIWDDRALALVDQAISTLSEKQQNVVRRLYGLQETAVNIVTLAKTLNCATHLISSIHGRALRKFCHPCVTHPGATLGLRILIQPVGNALQRELARSDAEDAEFELLDRTMTVQEMIVLGYLKSPVEMMKLSVRPANCLQCANIQLIGELVQRSPQDLLRFKHFGNRSLREIERCLAERGLGLSLGMGIDHPAVAAFNALKSARQSDR